MLECPEPSCTARFCGWCLVACGDGVVDYEKQCPSNPRRPLPNKMNTQASTTTLDAWLSARERRNERLINEYLESEVANEEVLASLEQRLNVVVGRPLNQMRRKRRRVSRTRGE